MISDFQAYFAERANGIENEDFEKIIRNIAAEPSTNKHGDDTEASVHLCDQLRDKKQLTKGDRNHIVKRLRMQLGDVSSQPIMYKNTFSKYIIPDQTRMTMYVCMSATA